MMKTHLFQASAAYLPEDFIRVGQLTKRVDIFSCGIVRASFSAWMWASTDLSVPQFLYKQKIEKRPLDIFYQSIVGRRLGGSVVERLPLCQVMIPGSWDRVLHQALARSLPLPLPMSLPL